MSDKWLMTDNGMSDELGLVIDDWLVVMGDE